METGYRALRMFDSKVNFGTGHACTRGGLGTKELVLMEVDVMRHFYVSGLHVLHTVVKPEMSSSIIDHRCPDESVLLANSP